MADIAANISLLRRQIPESVKIVAVSKIKPESDIMRAYHAGQRIFGENRVNELLSKKVNLPDDIEWHFIGHLQTNKVRQLVPHVTLIHSVDSLRLLDEINKESAKISIISDCLLQFHIAREETKFGFNMEEAARIFISGDLKRIKNVRIRGVMGMATFTQDMDLIRGEFRYLRKCYEDLKSEYFINEASFNEISMGMSGDFMIAIGEGATLVRIGSLIFGERNE